ncbi:hypothetical protein [Alteribacter natronophilus]|uniref:hypothetical protein n=1 Tax=Alteribacter natronophilus TaxID=2583810 RepID=UPI00110E867D|nr:hypothetical protein [Alteribacter natronophilus]TMW71164.1 hypothetical protein FGB90_14475 [Alteribacter natronophilus]
MGAPTGINGTLGIWSYDYSTVNFDNGEVTGWYDSGSNLLVNIEKVDSNKNIFSIGSTYQDVVDVMGTPTGINGTLGIWNYDYSTVNFDNGDVSGWSDTSNNLMVH